MRGEPIESVKVGLRALVDSLKRDSYAKETAYISVITFDREAKLLSPLTAISRAKVPDLPVPESSPTNLGEALELLLNRYGLEVRKSSPEKIRDYLPLAVIMTDGSPSDTMLFNSMCDHIKSYRFGRIIGCAAGHKAKIEPLKKFCTDVVTLDTMDINGFSKFWSWVSDTITHKDQTVLSIDQLPPPPPEIKFAI
jgi:uncharacterized protein YegL